MCFATALPTACGVGAGGAAARGPDGGGRRGVPHQGARRQGRFPADDAGGE